MTHTPGPWSARHNGHYWQIQAGDYDLIGDACASQFDGNGLKTPATLAKAAANARLMAAAPQTHAASKVLLERLAAHRSEEDWPQAMREAIADLRAAIAKAEGR